MKTPPFIFLPQHMDTVPVSIVKARSAEDQIDALYAAADAPGTSIDRQKKLLSLIKRMQSKMARNNPRRSRKRYRVRKSKRYGRRKTIFKLRPGYGKNRNRKRQCYGRRRR